jgi:hypothetical protein
MGSLAERGNRVPLSKAKDHANREPEGVLPTGAKPAREVFLTQGESCMATESAAPEARVCVPHS